MSLTKPIPLAIRNKLKDDLFMKDCCLASDECRGCVQWHHNLIYASNRINEMWCILPVCEWHHKKEAQFKKELNIIMCRRASYEELAEYSKAIDYVALKKKYEN